MSIYNLDKMDFSKIKPGQFMIDTNILYWVFYGHASYSIGYQKKYQNIIEKLINGDHKILTTTININELFNLVEKNSFKLYLSENESEISLKQYRNIDIERKRLEKDLKLLLKQIEKCMTILEENFSKGVLKAFAENFSKHRYDCFDYALIEGCRKNKITKIITDDGDFVDLNTTFDVFTYNKKCSE